MSELFCMLCLSSLSEESGWSELAQSQRSLRSQADAMQISGLLVFDGSRILQYFEGPPTSVQELTLNVARNPLHQQFSVSYAGARLGARRFSNWRTGYPLQGHEDVLLNFAQTPAHHALPAFEAMLPKLDID